MKERTAECLNEGRDEEVNDWTPEHKQQGRMEGRTDRRKDGRTE